MGENPSCIGEDGIQSTNTPRVVRSLGSDSINTGGYDKIQEKASGCEGGTFRNPKTKILRLSDSRLSVKKLERRFYGPVPRSPSSEQEHRKKEEHNALQEKKKRGKSSSGPRGIPRTGVWDTKGSNIGRKSSENHDKNVTGFVRKVSGEFQKEREDS